MRSWTLLSFAASIAVSVFACSIQDPENGNPDGSSGPGGATSTGMGASSAGGGAVGTGGGGATPGFVACGTDTCAVPAEKCCPSTGSCVASSETCATLPCAFYCDGGDSGSYAEISCDDAGDCADGQVCCTQDAQESGYLALSCAAAPCDHYEVCLPDGGCSDGQQCVTSKPEPTGAKCTGATPQVPCGDAVVCDADTPVCCADPLGCVAYGSVTCISMYECSGASDCGPGYSCCFDGVGATCSHECTAVLCDSAADCPEATPSCAEDAAGLHPAGIKSCQ